MTVKEICDKLDSFTDTERDEHVTAMCKLLSRVSMKTLMDFQRDWDGKKGFTEFIKAQAKEIRKCVTLEISHFGQTVRDIEELPELAWETEVVS